MRNTDMIKIQAQIERNINRQTRVRLDIFLLVAFFVILITVALLADEARRNKNEKTVNTAIENGAAVSVDGVIVEMENINLEWYRKISYDVEKNILYLSE